MWSRPAPPALCHLADSDDRSGHRTADRHPVGERAPDGGFPAGTVNRAVVDRLQAFLKLRKEVEADEEGRGKKR